MGIHQNSVLDAVPVAARPLIETLMEDVLRSGPFRTSKQCQDLFRYIVVHSLAGSDDSLRERVIGMDVFGRAPDYDTSEDPVVRLRAADIRKRLAQYYQARSGEPGEWKIEIPTGSYKAHFHPPEITAIPDQAAGVALVPQIEPDSPGVDAIEEQAIVLARKRPWLPFVALAGCLVVGIAAILLSLSMHRSADPADLFWAPVLGNSGPVLICTGSNRVFRLSEDARIRYRQSHPRPEEATPNFELPVPKTDLKSLTGEDFISVSDTYLTVGDASATAQLASLFTAHHHAFDIRFGSDLSFGDLREGSAVLIGAFNNNWTLNMTDNLRFVFDGSDAGQMHIQDKFNPSLSWWPKFSNGKFIEDYAIVSRLLNSKTGNVVVAIAGLDHTGTRAAGDFVTNPQMLAEFAKRAPNDWSRKNFQVVLHTNVVNGIPGSPTIVAEHFW